MPTLLTDEPRAPRPVAWTREACRRMEEIGILPERWELVRGEVINKMGQKLPHGRGVLETASWLRQACGSAYVASQVTIDVSPADNPTSEPEPDVIVVNEPVANITGNPRPEQIVLVVEVADSTLAYDLDNKASLYAAANIPEYWVLEIRGPRLHRHSQPRAGRYQSIQVLGPTQTVQAPGTNALLPVASLLG